MSNGRHFFLLCSQSLNVCMCVSLLFSCSVVCLTLCNPMDCSKPGFPIHYLPEFAHSGPSCQWCHPTISSSVVPFSSHLLSFPASGSFPDSVLYVRWPKYCIRSFPDSVIWFFTSGGPSIAVSASASGLPMNIQDWFPLGLTGFISLQSRGCSRVFSNTTVQKHQFFGPQLSYSPACLVQC